MTAWPVTIRDPELGLAYKAVLDAETVLSRVPDLIPNAVKACLMSAHSQLQTAKVLIRALDAAKVPA